MLQVGHIFLVFACHRFCLQTCEIHNGFAILDFITLNSTFTSDNINVVPLYILIPKICCKDCLIYIIYTDLSSESIWWYLALFLVLYLSAAIRRLHFCRQTGSKPGCSVMHFRQASWPTSLSTCSLTSACPHSSISQQHKHSLGLLRTSLLQFPHLHLYW